MLEVIARLTTTPLRQRTLSRIIGSYYLTRFCFCTGQQGRQLDRKRGPVVPD
jgi:hypothetical protein